MTMTEQPVQAGRAPGGMWWVAWRQHRIQLAIAVGLMAVGAVLMVVFRMRLVATLTEVGCTETLAGTGYAPCLRPDGTDIWYSDWGFNTWNQFIVAAAVGTPLVLGVFLGAALFPREFEQGTHVYALSQSVSRARWWAVKVAVVGVPLVVGLLALGLIKESVDASSGYTAGGAMSTTAFATRSIVPAGFGLVVFALAVTVGIITRRTVVALVISAVLGLGVLIALTSPLRAAVVPADRYSEPLNASGYSSASPLTSDADAWYVSGGYLGADGHVISYAEVYVCSANAYQWDRTLTEVQNSDASQQKWLTCMKERGVVASFEDVVPGTMLWPMRLIVTGIFLALSVLLLAAGAWRLRAAVAKR